MSASQARRRDLGPVGLVLTTVAGALAVLHSAGSGGLGAPPLTDPGRWPLWLSQHDPLLAAMAVLRLVALATGWYVLVTAVVGLTLRRAGALRLVVVADKVTLPAIRRLLVSAAGLTLASGAMPSLALPVGPQLPAAVALPAPLHAAAAGQFTTTTTTGPLPEATGRPPPTVTMRLLPDRAPAATEPPPAPGAPRAPQRGQAESTAATWRVRPGECFWSIAEDVLARAWGRPASAAEVVPYWKAMVEANRAALADRTNADLVFPGQVFTVPPVPPVPATPPP